MRRLSEESLATELCEGPVPDSPKPTSPYIDDEAATSCRAELIERLKRGESPTWIPSRRVCNFAIVRPRYLTDSELQLESFLQNRDASPSPRTSSESSRLLPAAQITPEKLDSASVSSEDRLREGLGIERPRSALHTGDFTQSRVDSTDSASRGRNSNDVLDHDREPVLNNWIPTSPPRNFTPFRFERRIPFPDRTPGTHSDTGSPLSSSLSSSFAYQPPTSPLVQSESNDEMDYDMSSETRQAPQYSHPSMRRHTLYSANSSPFASSSPKPLVSRLSHRRDGSFAYQAHQPRRSLTSTPSLGLPGTSPQSPVLFRSRRPSIASDSSPIQHASMVGSYEESILRGRMSTTPSKPFDFVAQIGVLGKGNCKPSLLCPAHITLPFPAVYYNYSSTSHGRSRSDDGPSPYVGQIDLENGLPNSEEQLRSKHKTQRRYSDRQAAHVDFNGPDVELMDAEYVSVAKAPLSTTTRAAKRKCASPKAPPGGSYRIPEKGQIQIVIKNQHKTAVKLFLVPYDLSGMEPGTKTFIRQRSYSAGPIIAEDVPNMSENDSMSRPMLRYLVHLHICCPARGRFYLYKSIRVVFANRVPEGKEKLHNDTTWPDPRFTPYKPIRAMPMTTSGPGALLAVDKAFRRRSLGISYGGPSSRVFDEMDGIASQQHRSGGARINGGGTARAGLEIDAIPFRLPTRDRSDSSNVSVSDQECRSSPGSSRQAASRPSTKDSGRTAWGPTSPYEKLNRGDFGYGGQAFTQLAESPRGAEGLLSQRLRSMGVNKPPLTESAEDLA